MVLWFDTHLKKAVANVVCIHCVVDRQHLVTKNLGRRLHETLRRVIKAVNLLKKSALQDRLFQQLWEENDEEFNDWYYTPRSAAYVVSLHFGIVLARS